MSQDKEDATRIARVKPLRITESRGSFARSPKEHLKSDVDDEHQCQISSTPCVPVLEENDNDGTELDFDLALFSQDEDDANSSGTWCFSSSFAWYNRNYPLPVPTSGHLFFAPDYPSPEITSKNFEVANASASFGFEKQSADAVKVELSHASTSAGFQELSTASRKCDLYKAPTFIGCNKQSDVFNPCQKSSCETGTLCNEQEVLYERNRSENTLSWSPDMTLFEMKSCTSYSEKRKCSRNDKGSPHHWKPTLKKKLQFFYPSEKCDTSYKFSESDHEDNEFVSAVEKDTPDRERTLKEVEITPTDGYSRKCDHTRTSELISERSQMTPTNDDLVLQLCVDSDGGTSPVFVQGVKTSMQSHPFLQKNSSSELKQEYSPAESCSQSRTEVILEASPSEICTLSKCRKQKYLEFVTNKSSKETIIDMKVGENTYELKVDENPCELKVVECSAKKRSDNITYEEKEDKSSLIERINEFLVKARADESLHELKTSESCFGRKETEPLKLCKPSVSEKWQQPETSRMADFNSSWYKSESHNKGYKSKIDIIPSSFTQSTMAIETFQDPNLLNSKYKNIISPSWRSTKPAYLCSKNQHRTSSYKFVYSDLQLITTDYSPGFIDSHCHLDFLFQRQFHNGTFQAYMEKQNQSSEAFPVSFEGCLTVFCDPMTFSKDWWKDLLSESDVWGAFGCHPHHVSKFHGNEKWLQCALQHSKVVALGEIGLDYSERNNEDRELQMLVFRCQLKIAMKYKMPLVIHCRDAHEDCIGILKEVVPHDYLIHRHCFTGTWQEAQEWLSTFQNLYIGFTPLISKKNKRGQMLHGVVRKIPLDRILLETDAPYFHPNFRGFSHPGMAIHVAAQIAYLKDIDIQTVLKYARENTFKINFPSGVAIGLGPSALPV
ncbi:putative deoxyribonuclease tatdn2 [Halocaridina rubra]|uniref:Deoxyribonuclease tatdn2 n=1 Tax=Halocaridina rubra TaxID=373956 RepID=A0AAN8X8X8_HALRR